MRASRIVELERLRQIVVRTRLESLEHVLGAAARREHQDRQELPAARSSAATVNPSLPGSITSRTTTSKIRRSFSSRCERPLAVGRDHRVMAFGFEVEPEAVGDVLLVLDDEDAAHVVSRGSSSVNVAPRPSPSLCANTRPPCARAIDRTM